MCHEGRVIRDRRARLQPRHRASPQHLDTLALFVGDPLEGAWNGSLHRAPGNSLFCLKSLRITSAEGACQKRLARRARFREKAVRRWFQTSSRFVMAGRPISLRAVRERLLTAIRNACVPWRATYSGKAPLNEDAENAFLRIVVAWETFLSDWLVSAVVRDPTVLGTKYQHDLEEWLAGKYGLSVADYQAATHLPALKARRCTSPLPPLKRSARFWILAAATSSLET